jgi:hypothetical protein
VITHGLQKTTTVLLKLQHPSAGSLIFPIMRNYLGAGIIRIGSLEINMIDTTTKER